MFPSYMDPRTQMLVEIWHKKLVEAQSRHKCTCLVPSTQLGGIVISIGRCEQRTGDALLASGGPITPAGDRKE
jgi:hypothetical protein